MISINLTLFFEIILLFLFFIFSRKLIWKPLLQTIREREDYFKKKENEIQNNYQKTTELKDSYKREIENVQKTLESKIDNTIRSAYIQQRTLIEKEQKKAHEQLTLYRSELQKQFCIDKTEIEKHAKTLSEKIVQCLVTQKRIF